MNAWSPLALWLAAAGFALLSFAMSRHQRALFKHEFEGRRAAVLRATGASSLALALWPCVHALGGPIGTVAWCGALSAGGALLVLAMSYAPRLVLWLGGSAPLAALASLVFARLV